ncbi:unnamed protein product [Rotaria sp. Silwood2]|nr:unnamed protein product [Rotaria sp. Silwood2]CAF4714627.1 unnamed protein product [Rotaria sp. Silwood2]CAF4757500.1 unnamed protein product [Rotaria sp. Silwood2]CAF4930756.1 unnamed protein product [Rotaria sp. Silwood2]
MLKSSRLDLLVLYRIYTPQNVRCCEQHIFRHARLNPMDIVEIDARKRLNSHLQSQDLPLSVEDLLKLIQEAIKSSRLDFRDAMLSNDDYLA